MNGGSLRLLLALLGLYTTLLSNSSVYYIRDALLTRKTYTELGDCRSRNSNTGHSRTESTTPRRLHNPIVRYLQQYYRIARYCSRSGNNTIGTWLTFKGELIEFYFQTTSPFSFTPFVNFAYYDEVDPSNNYANITGWGAIEVIDEINHFSHFSIVF